MATPAPRTPSLLLVLLPGLVLALLGGQAVVAELSSAESGARDRAREAAGRLARSVERTVDEFAAALPPAGTRLSPEGARSAVEHLFPRWVVDLNGRELEPPSAPLSPPDPAEDALVRDVLDRAEGEETDRDGQEIAAALCRAGAAAVKSRAARAVLLAGCGSFEARAGRPLEALEAFEQATGLGRGARNVRGEPLEPILAEEALRVSAGREDGGLEPWLLRLCERVAADPWGLDDKRRAAILDRAEGLADRDWAAGLRELREARDAVRAAARSLAAGTPLRNETLAGGPGRLVVRVLREVRIDTDGDPQRAVIGGDVPAVTVASRLIGEAEALVSDGSVATVDLLTPDGAAAIRARREAPAASVAIGELPLPAPFSDWRVQAAVEVPEGLPPFALLLALACVAMTIALALGGLSLRRAAERSAQLAEDRRTFLDHVAHEIRTPSASLLALSEELRSGGVPEGERDAYEEQMVAEARRLAALIEDTLDVARIDAGRLVFRTEPTDLRQVVDDAVAVAVARTGAEPGSLNVDLPDAPVVAAADAASLRRAIASLADNAIRHGRSPTPVRIALSTSGGRATIVVTDKGGGIAAAHLARLFERFYRVPSETHEAKGVGLGLALCREIVRAHGGDVSATSEPGRGTTMRITLPLGGSLA